MKVIALENMASSPKAGGLRSKYRRNRLRLFINVDEIAIDSGVSRPGQARVASRSRSAFRTAVEANFGLRFRRRYWNTTQYALTTSTLLYSHVPQNISWSVRRYYRLRISA